MANDFSIGVEEEYQLVDRASRALSARIDDVFPDAHDRVDEDVSHELQQAQIEIGTPICRTLDDVQRELTRLRDEVGAAAASRGLAIVAAGSHPMPSLADTDITNESDYRLIAEQYAHLAREQVIFGCHVHVGVADRELAIAAMNHARPWLPVLLALSGSSPFWDGVDTGYASYRSEVFARWPTAGPPELFASRAEYDEVVRQLMATGSIDDPARIYWDARPSVRYETVEVRIADVCTSVDDAVLVAGLAGGLIRHGAAAALAGGEPSAARPEIMRAARWRAARYGMSGDLVVVTESRSAPAADVVRHLLGVLGPSLAEWGELERVTELVEQVVARGTSAQRQRRMLERGATLPDVVDWLVDETARGSTVR
jgi:carboxylate-amine ligase